MTPREIVAEAWAITTRERQLWWWGFTDSFFETLLNIKLLAYQGYFLYKYLKGGEAGLFDDVLWLNDTIGLNWTALIVAIFLLLILIELFIPHLTEGAVIGLSAKSHRGEEVKGGLVLALYNFFPLFAVHESFILSSWSTSLMACSLILRYFPSSLKLPFVLLTITLWILMSIFRFFGGFAEQAVVLKKCGVFEGISRSYKLMISHLGHIMFLLVLLLVISVRVLVNAMLVFIVPGLAIGLGIALTYVFSPFWSYLIASVVGLGLITFVSYFLAYLHVFKRTVWTLTFMYLDKIKDLDQFDEL